MTSPHFDFANRTTRPLSDASPSSRGGTGGGFGGKGSPLASPTYSNTPTSTPRLYFNFFDEKTSEVMNLQTPEALPGCMLAVMERLCDVFFVPQKLWDVNEIGDYPFCQVVTDILNNNFGGSFVQMTKLKQQLKSRLGGRIRIGPLKALIIAYPQYFGVDRNVTLVRANVKELPYMDVKTVAEINPGAFFSVVSATGETEGEGTRK
jgi:hypothetical protein